VLVPPRESPRLSWPDDQLEAVERCPICGGRERIRLYDGLQNRVHHCAPGEWTLYQCRACRSAFLDPRPSVAAIGLAYARYYTHETQAAATPQSLLARLRTRLRNGYVLHRFGVPAEPWSRFGVVAEWLLPARRAVVDTEMRHLPHPWAGARFLDVGCGNGAFLDRARRAGWDVMGVDPDPVAVQAARCRGLNVQRGSIECLDADTFDVITLNHVIEHVHDPVAVLRRCRKSAPARRPPLAADPEPRGSRPPPVRPLLAASRSPASLGDVHPDVSPAGARPGRLRAGCGSPLAPALSLGVRRERGAGPGRAATVTSALARVAATRRAG
jgi:SAM-dependent methyltransferase